MEGLTNEEYYRKHRYRAYANPKSHSSHGNNRQGFNGFNQFPPSPYFGNIILPVNLSNSSKLTDEQVFEIKKYIMSFSRFFNDRFKKLNDAGKSFGAGENYTVLYNNLPEYAPDIKKSGPRPTIGIMGSVIGPEGLVSPYYKTVPVQNALMAYSMLLSSPLNGRNGETYGNRLDKIKKLGIEYEKIKKLLDEYNGSAKDAAAKSKISSYVVFTDDKLVGESDNEAKGLESMSDNDALKLLKDFKITPSIGASAGTASSKLGMGGFPPTGTLTDPQFDNLIKVFTNESDDMDTDVNNEITRLNRNYNIKLDNVTKKSQDMKNAGTSGYLTDFTPPADLFKKIREKLTEISKLSAMFTNFRKNVVADLKSTSPKTKLSKSETDYTTPIDALIAKLNTNKTSIDSEITKLDKKIPLTLT